MKYIKMIACFVIATIALSGCAINSGTVIEKQFIPEHYETKTESVMVPAIGVSGKAGMSIAIVQQQTVGLVPDAWIITIEGEDDKGKTRTATVYVSQETFDSLSIGDQYAAEGSTGK